MYYIGLSTNNIVSGPYKEIPTALRGENIYKQENNIFILQPERACGICGESFFGNTYYCSAECEAEAKYAPNDSSH